MTSWTVALQTPLSMGILQARILEWVVMASSRGSSQPRDQTQVSFIAGGVLPSELPGKPWLSSSCMLCFIRNYQIIFQSGCTILYSYHPCMRDPISPSQHLMVSLFFFFGHETYGILAPRRGLKPTSPALEGEILTSGPLGSPRNGSFTRSPSDLCAQ